MVNLIDDLENWQVPDIPELIIGYQKTIGDINDRRGINKKTNDDSGLLWL